MVHSLMDFWWIVYWTFFRGRSGHLVFSYFSGLVVDSLLDLRWLVFWTFIGQFTGLLEDSLLDLKKAFAGQFLKFVFDILLELWFVHFW